MNISKGILSNIFRFKYSDHLSNYSNTKPFAHTSNDPYKPLLTIQEQN